MAKDPTYRDVESFAADMSASALHCRELGHVWRAQTVDYDSRQVLFTRILRCSSCRTERQQTLNQHGHVLANSYRYPAGYLTTGIQDRTGISRDVFRLESLTRALHAQTRKAS
jgi:hypothetical protein